MATKTEPTMREIGYRSADALAECWRRQGRIALDEGADLGTRFVVAGPWVVYVCTDAQAWGTLYSFESTDAALAYVAERLAEVQALMSEMED